MNEINNKLNNISELIDRVDAKVLEINNKLDELIKALHDYDGNDEYGESSFEAFMDIDELDKDKDSNIQDERVVGDKDKHTGEDKKRNPKQAPREGYTEATPFVKTKDRRRYYKPKNK